MLRRGNGRLHAQNASKIGEIALLRLNFPPPGALASMAVVAFFLRRGTNEPIFEYTVDPHRRRDRVRVPWRPRRRVTDAQELRQFIMQRRRHLRHPGNR